MSGCFGNSPYDRWLESQVNHHCDIPDDPECPECEGVMALSENEEEWVCPECGHTIQITDEFDERTNDEEYKYNDF